MTNYAKVNWPSGIWTQDGLPPMDQGIYDVHPQSTVSSLESAIGYTDGTVIPFLGYSSVADGGGGFVRRVAASSATRDGGMVFTSAQGGRWERMFLDGAPISARGFGAKGDATGNDRPALQAALNAASASKRPLVIEPGTYNIDTSYVIFPSNVTVYAFGATLKLIYSEANTPVARITDADNIRIYGLTLDGNKAAFTGVTTEQKHGFWVVNGRNIYLEACLSKNNKGDGIVIVPNTTTQAQPENITAVGSVFDTNHRQAMSITSLKHGNFYGCEFKNTSGTLPQSGVDHEPDYDWAIIDDVHYYGCSFTGNVGNGVLLGHPGTFTPGSPETGNRGVTFHGCRMAGNTKNGLHVAFARGAEFYGCSVRSNGQYGAYVGDMEVADLKFFGGEIRDNQKIGLYAPVVANTSIRRMQLNNVSILNNGKGLAGAFDRVGIWVYVPSATGTVCDDILINGCTIGNVAGDTTQNYGLLATTDGVGTISRLRHIHNTYINNQTQAVYPLEDDITTRIDADNIGHTSTVGHRRGTGAPNSAITGRVGDTWTRTDGGTTTTFYVKESGNGTNTGWVAK